MFRHLLLVACLMAPVGALAQGAQVAFGGSSQNTSAPVEVTADSLSINQSDGTALYSGNVLVVQDTMRLSAPRVLVVYGQGGGSIQRFEATGGVTLVSGEEAAEAERADYNVADGNVVMKGNVLMTQGASALASQQMIVNLKDGTAQLTGRVRTVLNNE
jgi:lipopolysaccharide export system protein LptA